LLEDFRKARRISPASHEIVYALFNASSERQPASKLRRIISFSDQIPTRNKEMAHHLRPRAKRLVTAILASPGLAILVPRRAEVAGGFILELTHLAGNLLHEPNTGNLQLSPRPQRPLFLHPIHGSAICVFECRAAFHNLFKMTYDKLRYSNRINTTPPSHLSAQSHCR
jgi:hypothetical protein